MFKTIFKFILFALVLALYTNCTFRAAPKNVNYTYAPQPNQPLYIFPADSMSIKQYAYSEWLKTYDLQPHDSAWKPAFRDTLNTFIIKHLPKVEYEGPRGNLTTDEIPAEFESIKVRGDKRNKRHPYAFTIPKKGAIVTLNNSFVLFINKVVILTEEEFEITTPTHSVDNNGHTTTYGGGQEVITTIFNIYFDYMVYDYVKDDIVTYGSSNGFTKLSDDLTKKDWEIAIDNAFYIAISETPLWKGLF